jgi:hypothetical protein
MRTANVLASGNLSDGWNGAHYSLADAAIRRRIGHSLSRVRCPNAP